MRRFEELPLEEGMALIEVLVEQGLLDEDWSVTPLGEAYIIAFTTAPLDLTNMSEIVKYEQP